MIGENCATLHHQASDRILDVDNLGVGDLWCCFYCWQDRPTGEGLITSSCVQQNVRTETTSEGRGGEETVLVDHQEHEKGNHLEINWKDE